MGTLRLRANDSSESEGESQRQHYRDKQVMQREGVGSRPEYGDGTQRVREHWRDVLRPKRTAQDQCRGAMKECIQPSTLVKIRNSAFCVCWVEHMTLLMLNYFYPQRQKFHRVQLRILQFLKYHAAQTSPFYGRVPVHRLLVYDPSWHSPWAFALSHSKETGRLKVSPRKAQVLPENSYQYSQTNILTYFYSEHFNHIWSLGGPCTIIKEPSWITRSYPIIWAKIYNASPFL